MEKSLSIKLLYTALADELLASYQYWVCKNLSRGEGKFDVDPEFEQHEKEEKEHADKIMERLKQLGGAPIPDPKDWTKFSNPWDVVDFRDVKRQLEITMNAEQAAIDFYSDSIEQLRGKDEVTLKLFRNILVDEEEHLYDLKELYAEFEEDIFEDDVLADEDVEEDIFSEEDENEDFEDDLILDEDDIFED